MLNDKQYRHSYNIYHLTFNIQNFVRVEGLPDMHRDKLLIPPHTDCQSTCFCAGGGTRTPMVTR